MRCRLVLLAFAAASVAMPRGAARAQWMACDLSTCHVALACASDAECAPLSTPACEAFDTGVDGMGGARRVCRPLCGTLFKCDGSGLTPRCPVLGGDPGVCGTGVTGSSLFTAVCRYPGWGIGYCTDTGEISASRFYACHHIGGAPTPNYLEGDCDGDGCPNYRDPHPCAVDAATACPAETSDDLTCIGPGTVLPPPDGGVVDAGATDAGAVGLDAGAVGIDAGAVGIDAGAVALDSGEVALDSGEPTPDASEDVDSARPRPDATTAGPDASASGTLDGGGGFEGGGGCSCRAATPRRDPPAALAALCAIALGLVARARRRR